ncbi:endonuclease-reverse transcriptase [Plakobranchus ocellatus]|uniref:Endonuclease-reverse transcriptase n=1 Tax=Plakobranchus ocellatus TaxID=259542 RepID=A0AAV4AD63_9GAST|nr:endonuclease-reverse transcriptase [Plakobranchus ocellatus]
MDRQTLDQIVTLENSVKAAKTNSRVGATFLDLEKAHDTIWRFCTVATRHKLNHAAAVREYMKAQIEEGRIKERGAELITGRWGLHQKRRASRALHDHLFCSAAKTDLEDDEKKAPLSPNAWTAKKTNDTVLEEAHTTRLLISKIRKRQATFFGHVMRREKLENLVTTGMLEGKRSRGKQREKLIEGLTDWLKAGKSLEAIEATKDRKKWRTMIANAVKQGT